MGSFPGLEKTLEQQNQTTKDYDICKACVDIKAWILIVVHGLKVL
jgi:hypothetical protein